MSEAILALEDGTIYRGVAAGAEGDTRGEVVFNTSMTGYQEILTDPSYSGQIVTMTCAEIGNYGVATADVESRTPRVAGFIIRDRLNRLYPLPSKRLAPDLFFQLALVSFTGKRLFWLLAQLPAPPVQDPFAHA